jgi:hypothetical protein
MLDPSSVNYDSHHEMSAESEPILGTKWMNGLIRAKPALFMFIIISLLSAGCLSESPAQPTKAASAPTLTATAVVLAEETSVLLTVPATFTPKVMGELSSPTPANLPSRTARPTQTPWPTNTPTSTATRTPRPTTAPVDTPVPSPTTIPVAGINVLPNPSFEEGWYHINGIPELQVANQWTLEWDVGSNYLDPDPWNDFVRPESRVINDDFLPADEHQLFIWDGNYTVKIFKKTGALSFRLLSDVYLEPGSYLFEINVFPDMIDGYTVNGTKIWAPDPLSAELQFIAGNSVGNWIFPIFGQRNTYQHAFQVPTAGFYRIGVGFRGRWAIENNGWFMDDWSLRQLS